MNPLKQLVDHVRQTTVTLLLTACALTLFAVPEIGRCFEFTLDHFQFALTDFEWSGRAWPQSDLWQACLQWRNGLRVVGCNWLHWSPSHLFWDTAMFIVLGSLCERRGRLVTLWTLVIAALVIPVCVLMTAPELGSYRGLSGIDTALFALLATGLLIDELRRQDWARVLLFAAMLGAMALKVGFELNSHQNLFVSNDGFIPVPLAHVLGAIIGVACAGLRAFQNRAANDPNVVYFARRYTLE